MVRGGRHFRFFTNIKFKRVFWEGNNFVSCLIKKERWCGPGCHAKRVRVYPSYSSDMSISQGIVDTVSDHHLSDFNVNYILE